MEKTLIGNMHGCVCLMVGCKFLSIVQKSLCSGSAGLILLIPAVYDCVLPNFGDGGYDVMTALHQQWSSCDCDCNWEHQLPGTEIYIILN